MSFFNCKLLIFLRKNLSYGIIRDIDITSILKQLTIVFLMRKSDCEPDILHFFLEIITSQIKRYYQMIRCFSYKILIKKKITHELEY